MCAKIIAKQVPPEYQESPWEYQSDLYTRLVAMGNRDYGDFGDDDLMEIIEFAENWAGYTLEDYDEYFEDVASYFTEDEEVIAELKKILEYREIDHGNRWRHNEKKYCKVLNILVGGNWEYKRGRGCAQSEWQDFYYDADEYKNIDYVIMEYFNEGTEWICWQEGDDEDNGCSVYCYSWKDEDIKKEIMRAMGGDEVELRKFTGWSRLAKYEVV